MATRLEEVVCATPSSKVELALSARGLKDMDVFTKSDPMVVVWLRNSTLQSWDRVGSTEVIYNNLNPDFATKIVLLYKFEQQQQLKFDVFDIDSSHLERLSDHDFLGTCTVNLGEIISNGKMNIPLTPKTGKSSNKLGHLIITAEELSPNQDVVTMQFAASGLKSSWWCRANPYLEAHKISENAEHILVYRSEVISSKSNPLWKPTAIKKQSLCGGDYDMSIRLRCLSDRGRCSPKLLGETFLTLRQLTNEESKDFSLIHPEKETLCGSLFIKQCTIEPRHSFLEYVLGGMQFQCTIAIDFTSSNGYPHEEGSLHYICEAVPNQYEQALLAVVPILQDYDHDKVFPLLGFGAKFPPRRELSHEFLINGACQGVQGVLDAYKKCIRKVQLFGPTIFTSVINYTARMAARKQDGSQYFVLLIITDGVISDMFQTKQAIIEASTLPLSIIIIGVGPADFTAMCELDGDICPLTASGRTTARDIVQFVPFRDFQGAGNKYAVRQLLAEEVLAEIPDQVESFMRLRKIKPGERPGPTAPPHPEDPPPPYSEVGLL